LDLTWRAEEKSHMAQVEDLNNATSKINVQFQCSRKLKTKKNIEKDGEGD
jgi:hypothetical protein